MFVGALGRKGGIMEGLEKGVATPQEILNGIGIDRFCEMIAEDMSYRDIAKEIGVSKSTIGDWVGSDPGRSARVREALKDSAQVCDAKGLAALQGLPDEPTAGQVAKAREIASHYRWRAKARNPAEYGDKVDLTGEISVSNRDITSLESALLLSFIMKGQARMLAAAQVADPLEIEVNPPDLKP